MTEADTDAVCRIMADCYRLIASPDQFTPHELQRLLDECCIPPHINALSAGCACFVAQDAADVVGFIAVGSGTIEELFVTPARHRTGIGRALFQHAEHSLLRAGSASMSLTTTGYGLPFYDAMGMRISHSVTATGGPLEGRQLTLLTKLLPAQPVGKLAALTTVSLRLPEPANFDSISPNVDEWTQ